MLQTITDKSGKERHKKWLANIRAGKFSFGSADISYVPKGQGSWKYDALGTDRFIDTGEERFSYRPDFLKSNWKLFHDALKFHRLYITHEFLPQYGICIA